MLGALAYLALAPAAWLTGDAWLASGAVFVLASLILAPALRRRSALAWSVWLGSAALLLALAARGAATLVLDAIPVAISAALCTLFARTLRPGREPLIARVIAALEGVERLALPRVAAYARALTAAWALLLGAQALLLAGVLVCAQPGGVFAAFGLTPPFALTGAAWRGYLHVGGYVLVPAFLGLEYAFRRWHLRALPHMPLPLFVARLVQRWPAVLRGLTQDAPRGRT